MRRDYSSDVEGGRPVRIRYQIGGRLDVPAYLAFVAERARWLAISGWAMADGDGVTLVADGPEALVGALEMACTLGPLEALVTHIVGADTQEPVGAGFELR
jgi:acylphosphatase